MLKITNLEAGYGGSIVLHGVSLEVRDGEAVVLLGPNSGLIRPSAGRIEFDGKVLSEMSPAEIVAAGVVHIPQGDLPFPELTVLENLLMGAYLPDAWKQRRQKLEQVYELFPVLRERSNQLARTLSGGERRMLALGRGLMSNAKLLMVDEPSLGLAPFLIEEVYRKIRDINKSGLSVLLADENADHIAGFADRVYLLEMGSIVSEGTAEEMLKNEALLAAYLG